MLSNICAYLWYYKMIVYISPKEVIKWHCKMNVYVSPKEVIVYAKVFLTTQDITCDLDTRSCVIYKHTGPNLLLTDRKI